jgi:hypothetical protein
MNARRIAVVVSIAVLGLLPSGALAHGEHDHAAEDSVPLDHVAPRNHHKPCDRP